jgi:replicative DNA helicase
MKDKFNQYIADTFDRFRSAEQYNYAQIEKVFLGCVLAIGKSAIEKVKDRNFEPIFFNSQDQEIYKNILFLYDSNIEIDLVTVSNRLRNNKFHLLNPSYRSYLLSLTELCINSWNFNEYLNIFIEKQIRYNLFKLVNNISDYACGDSFDKDTAIDFIESSMEIVRDDRKLLETEQPFNPDDFINDILEGQPKEVCGFKTGFADFDNITLGLQPGKYSLIGARPSMGKSTLGLQIAYNVQALNDTHVHLHLTESSKEDTWTRLTAMASQIPSRKVKLRDLKMDEKANIKFAYEEKLREMNLTMYDKTSQTVNYIKDQAIKSNKSGKKVGLIIVDYVQQLELLKLDNSGREPDQRVTISLISRQLQKLAKDLDCHVLGLAQLSRNVESRADKRPVLSDLRETGNLEQDCDTVSFLYRDDYYNPESDRAGMADLITRKNRDGALGTAELLFNARIPKFLPTIKIQ